MQWLKWFLKNKEGCCGIFQSSFEHKRILFKEVTVNAEGNISGEDMKISLQEANKWSDESNKAYKVDE
jgi:hypothetical protein